jgi:transcriptional regulator with GAF, ATPase, and Fis domain
MKDPLSLSTLFAAFGNDLAAVDDKKSLLQLIASNLAPQLSFSDILLSILNEDRQTHRVFIHHCDPGRMAKCDYTSLSQEKFRIDDGVCNITMASPSPLVVDIASILLRPAPPRWIAQWYRPSISRMIAVRLRSHGQLLGSLFLFFEKALIGIDDLEMVQHFSYLIAPALKNILIDERISSRQQDNEVLLSLGADFMKIRDKGALFRLLDQRLRPLFEFDHACIGLIDPEKKVFRVTPLHQPASGAFEEAHPGREDDGIAYGSGLIGAALASGVPLVFDLDRYTSDWLPGAFRHHFHAGIREAAMVPLRGEGESFGVLILLSQTKERFTSRHLDILRPLSHQISVACTNIHAHEVFLEREKDKALILSLSRNLTSPLHKKDFPAVLEGVLRSILPYDEMIVSLLTADGDTHTYQQYPVQEAIYDVVLQSEVPLVFDPDHHLMAGTPAGMREMLAIPLRENNQGFGGIFIYVKEKGLLTHRVLHLLQELCIQISTGMANSRAYEKMERQLEEIHHHKFRLEEENLYLQEQVRTAHGFTEMIGAGGAMQKVFQLVSIVAPSDSTVLILGEKGTGKELVARAIHDASSRKDKFMIKVNCAALPANLIESELFGHEGGSFAGAGEMRIGKFEMANDSTLFLDEIGELSLELQARLLKAIQEKEIERTGGKDVIRANVRIIASTNRNLRKEVEAGRFRSDLFYRLNIFPIQLPPLRERKEDLPILASHFIMQHTRRTGKKITNISHLALESLMRYDWPGNVRELEHIIERSILMAAGPTIKEVPLPAGHDTGVPTAVSGISLKTLDELEKEHIVAVLKKCNYKVGGSGGAAELLQLPPTTLHSKIKKLGIKNPR